MPSFHVMVGLAERGAFDACCASCVCVWIQGSEPTLARLPSVGGDVNSGGPTWLMFSIGNRSSSFPPRTDCAGGYTPKAAPANHKTGGNFKHAVPVEIASTRNLTADDWTLMATIGNGDFNPSPLVCRSLAFLFRHRGCGATAITPAVLSMSWPPSPQRARSLFLSVCICLSLSLSGRPACSFPAPHHGLSPRQVLPNGTTLLMWRHLARTHMVLAPSWRGGYAFNGSDRSCPPSNGTAGRLGDHARPNGTLRPGAQPGGAELGDPGCEWWHLFDAQVDARGIEDPFMFIQPANGPAGGTTPPNTGGQAPPGGHTFTFHALFHDHVSFGGHAFSADGVVWTYSSVAPYGNSVASTDGSNVSLQRRERPHLVFDDRGYITHLTTAAQPPPTAGKAPPSGSFNNDYSYTSVQPVVRQA